MHLCTRWLYVIADSEYYKSQALRNAQEAYQIHQERVSNSRTSFIRCPNSHSATGGNVQISSFRRECSMKRLKTAAVRPCMQLAACPQEPALGLEKATAFQTHPSAQMKTFLSPPSSTENSRATNSKAWTGWLTFMNRYTCLILFFLLFFLTYAALFWNSQYSFSLFSLLWIGQFLMANSIKEIFISVLVKKIYESLV